MLNLGDSATANYANLETFQRLTLQKVRIRGTIVKRVPGVGQLIHLLEHRVESLPNSISGFQSAGLVSIGQ